MKLVVTENITLDGVIDASEGWFAPEGNADDVDTSDVLAVLRDHMERQSALLIGRVTFEELRGYWPLQTDDISGITAISTGSANKSCRPPYGSRGGTTRPCSGATW